MVEVSVGLIIENSLTALIIIAYLGYEIHFGRLDKMANHMDAVIDTVIAMARQQDGINEDAVAQRLNGHSPQDLIEVDEDDDED